MVFPHRYHPDLQGETCGCKLGVNRGKLNEEFQYVIMEMPEVIFFGEIELTL